MERAAAVACMEGGMGVTQRGWQGRDIDIEGQGGGLGPLRRGGVECRVCHLLWLDLQLCAGELAEFSALTSEWPGLDLCSGTK